MTRFVRTRGMMNLILLAGLALSAIPVAATAQTSSFAGDWTGYWDNSPNGWVEYRIGKTKGAIVTVSYGYKSASGATVHETIRCHAVSATELNCGPSSIVFTSGSSAEATMHATNGAMPTAALTR